MEKPFDDVRENLKRVREEIAEAAVRAGRKPEEVSLMGVTKTVAPDRVNAALDAGLRLIGENRVQELLQKRDALHLDGTAVHLIGHLQTNKVRAVLPAVSMVQSVDSERLARTISAESELIGRVTDVLLEVNIGREESKAGVYPERLEELLACAAALPGIRVRGLMTVPPISGSEKERRQFFSDMYKVFIDIRGKNIDNNSISPAMDVLSMGMSADFREAVLEGSTMVRVGSALFGPRNYLR